jgi:hypothetical protein
MWDEASKTAKLTDADERKYHEEYVRKHIRYVREMHNKDHEMQAVRQETLG